jgi:hypothetical protein
MTAREKNIHAYYESDEDVRHTSKAVEDHLRAHGHLQDFNLKLKLKSDQVQVDVGQAAGRRPGGERARRSASIAGLAPGNARARERTRARRAYALTVLLMGQCFTLAVVICYYSSIHTRSSSTWVVLSILIPWCLSTLLVSPLNVVALLALSAIRDISQVLVLVGQGNHSSRMVVSV